VSPKRGRQRVKRQKTSPEPGKTDNSIIWKILDKDPLVQRLPLPAGEKISRDAVAAASRLLQSTLGATDLFLV
jgi:hypothetical protein